jgi:hypothetical protein
MNILTEKLRSETESLRVQYVEKMAEWAVREYERAVEKKSWSAKEWAERYGVEAVWVEASYMSSKGFWSFPRGFHNSRTAVKYEREKNDAYRIAGMGREAYVEKMKKAANEHYEQSIEKLSARLEKKGLNTERLEMKTSHIGVNIETAITDGEKMVRAFTIVASGPVQRPHYRYLIK